MIPLAIPSQRIFILGGIAVAVVSSILLFSYFFQALADAGPGSGSGAVPVKSSSGTVYLSPQAAAAVASSTKQQTTQEIHIANSGLVLLRGARVLSVSGNTLRVAMNWDSTDFTWQVNIAYNTQLFASNGEKETLSDIAAGDVVTVTGTLSGGGTEPAVNAQFVRE